MVSSGSQRLHLDPHHTQRFLVICSRLRFWGWISTGTFNPDVRRYRTFHIFLVPLALHLPHLHLYYTPRKVLVCLQDFDSEPNTKHASLYEET